MGSEKVSGMGIGSSIPEMVPGQILYAGNMGIAERGILRGIRKWVQKKFLG